MELSSEQKIAQLWDTQEIRKLMAKYVYYGYGRTWERVPDMFSKRDDVWIDCEGFGIFDGHKGIETFFVEWHHSMEGDAEGMVSIHLLTTEVIEVAGDGKTARGLWFSPGTETRRKAADGNHEAFWVWGMYAIDFIKEDGEWKFWHFRIPHLLLCDYHHSWVDLDHIKLGSQIGHEGRPVADRPSSFPPTFYGTGKKTDLFFEPPIRYQKEDDLKDFWVRSER